MNGHTRGYGASGAFYRECARAGLTQAETARQWGVSKVTVSRWAAKNPDVSFVRGLNASTPHSLAGASNQSALVVGTR